VAETKVVAKAEARDVQSWENLATSYFYHAFTILFCCKSRTEDCSTSYTVFGETNFHIKKI